MPAKTPSRSVLLLRAVNLGARNKVPMADLRAALAEETDLADVSTYIASGNIICATPTDAGAACEQVRSLIHERFGVDTPVIARAHDELGDSLAAHPFADADEKLLHAMFLAGPPADGAIADLEERLVPGEELALVGNDLWISYAEGGVHTTKLSKSVLDRALGVPGTARNLRTVRKLVELTA